MISWNGRALVVSIFDSSSSSQLSATRELNSLHEMHREKKKLQILPENIRKDITYYAWKHGISEVGRWTTRKYPNFTFKRETVIDWKAKCRQKSSNHREADFFTLLPPGRPPMVSDGVVTKVKAILHNIRLSGGVITRKTTIAVGNGVLSSRCPDKIARNGGNITLTANWTRSIMKSMGWVKRRDTTEKERC